MDSLNCGWDDVMKATEKRGISSESSSESSAEVCLMETLVDGDRGGVVEEDRSGGGVVVEDRSGGGGVSDDSSSHDLGGCSQGRRGEHRQGRHQETGLRYEDIRRKKEFYIAP